MAASGTAGSHAKAPDPKILTEDMADDTADDVAIVANMEAARNQPTCQVAGERGLSPACQRLAAIDSRGSVAS